MKWWQAKETILTVCAGLALLISGCGSSSANVVTVSVTPSAASVLVGQVQTFTATVSGSTVTTVSTWNCTYSYQTPATTSNSNPKPTTGTCTSGGTLSGTETGSFGTWTISTANGSNVLTYTGPPLSSFPQPYALTLTFTAVADADKNKNGTATVGLDSGIRVSISPTNATVPVGLATPATQSFNVTFVNSPPVGVKFLLMQILPYSTTNPNNTSPSPLSTTCSPACGTVDANGIYTAPATVPTATTPSGGTTASASSVYLVAWSQADEQHAAASLITLVSASTNSVSYNGLYPTTIAAGGLLQDVFLNVKNLLNTSQVIFIPPIDADHLANGNQQPLTNATQVFTIPVTTAYCTPATAGTNGATTTTTCDASILTRVRLLAPQLAQAEPVVAQGQPEQPAWIVVTGLTSPATPNTGAGCVLFPGSTTAVACPIHIVNASPALVAAVPDLIPQPTSSQTVSFGANGGYYGYKGGLAKLSFVDQTAVLDPTNSGPRKLLGTTQSFQLPVPGLYEVVVSSNTTTGAPPQYGTLISNTAVQPNFANFVPNSSGQASATCTDPSLPAGTALSGAYPSCTLLVGSNNNPAPSAIAINSNKGYAVIAEQGTGALQLVTLNPWPTGPVQSGSPVQIGPATVAGVQPAPTDIAIDNQLPVNGGDLAAIVSTSDNTLYLYSVGPGGIQPVPGNKTISLDLRTLLNQPMATGLPAPVSVGVDTVTHLGVVAYQNTNVGFIVDVNPNLDGKDTRTCFLGGSAPCVVGPVSIVTGSAPKVVMQPNVPLAYVTPGGGNGTTSVVDLLQQGTTAKIEPFVSGGTSGAVRTAGITKIITSTPHGINPILGGTVIISGITTSTANSNFNGTYQILPGSVLDPYTFSYTQIGMADDVETNPASMPGTVEYGVPYYSFSTSTTVSGGAINPVTRTFGFADYNSSAGQIGFISTLDQTLSSLSLSAGSCNGCTPTPGGAPEIGFRSVAFDPFTDVMLAYAPTQSLDPNQNGNKLSLINPGGTGPNGSVIVPYRIIAAIPIGQVGQGSYTPTGQTTAVQVYGPMAYDPITKYALVASAGSNSLSTMSLDPASPGHGFQTAHVQAVELPNPSCTNASDPTTCFGVPVIQPPLRTSAPSKSPGPCSPVNPANPCMPQAVQVGLTAKLHILGQGFSAISSPVVRLDGQAAITPDAVTDTEIDITIPAAKLSSPHVYAVDVAPAGGGNPTNEVDLNVVGLADMSAACTTTSSFPQGPEGVAIDPTIHVALVTNYACNSVSIITIDPNGYMLPGGTIKPFGSVLSTIGVGNQPLGIGVIPRYGYAVVANSGDTPNGTASIIDYSDKLSSTNGTPDNPKIVSWNVTSGSTTTPTNKVTVGLSPLGVTVDQDRAFALVANNGSNTLSSIDLTTLLPTDPSSGTGHVQAAPAVTTVALSGPPTAIAIDPNRAIAAVTNLQNPGTTAVTGGIDIVSLASTPPVKSNTTSVSALAAALTGIVYDPGDPNTTNTTTTGVFYASSTQANAIYVMYPDTGSTNTIRVGINPYGLGYNYQSGSLLTVNSTSNSSSQVDVQAFKTRQTLGISSNSQFPIDVDNVTNIAVIPDQNNNRVLFLAMPK